MQAALQPHVELYHTHIAQLRISRMPRTNQHLMDTSFNLRIDPALKVAVTAATEAEDKPAAQAMRDLMRVYVTQRERRGLRRRSAAAGARGSGTRAIRTATNALLCARLRPDPIATTSVTSGTREPRRPRDDHGCG